MVFKEDEMSGACCACGGEKKCIQVFWWGNLKEITTRKT